MTELGENYASAHTSVFSGTELNLTVNYNNTSLTNYNITANLLDSRGVIVGTLTCTKEGVDDVIARVYLGATETTVRGIYYAPVIATHISNEDNAFCLVYIKITIR